MCTLSVYFRCSKSVPLLIAANRDEFYARESAAPRVIARDPWVVAGQDLQAGGTWLGANEHGLGIGVLNRRNPAGPDPARASRGILCLELLRMPSVHAALQRLESIDPAIYNWFNMLISDSKAAYVASNRGDRLSVTELDPGVHVLTNLDLNDPTCPRIAKSARAFAEMSLPADSSGYPALIEHLRSILSDHSMPLDPRGGDALNALCIHTPAYGTRSATILLWDGTRRLRHYWHADGPPCRTPFYEVSLPSSPSSLSLDTRIPSE